MRPDKKVSEFDTKLDELLGLIRVGSSSMNTSAGTGAAGTALKVKIEKLLKWLADRAEPERPISKMRYYSMRAEAEYSFGLIGNAAEELHKHLASDQSGRRPALDRWREGQSFLKHMDREGLRHTLWALMADAFYFDYLSGDTPSARDALLKIEKIIDTRLAAPKGISSSSHFGTRARVHELLAQVYRTLRDFDAAEHHFTESLRYADLRLDEALREVRTENDSTVWLADYQFGVICTARILGGLGRIAMLQGRLRRARLVLSSAAMLLRPTGQEALKSVIASHLAIIERRLCRPGDATPADQNTTVWERRLQTLADLANEFTAREDQDGTRRCLLELASARLDQAELSQPGSAAQENALQAAAGLIKGLRSRAKRHKSPNWRVIELYRVHVLDARYHMLTKLPNTQEADKALKDAAKLRNAFPVEQRELAVEDVVDARLTESILEALDTVGRPNAVAAVTDRFRRLAASARAAQDTILEGEATLRAAQVNARAGYEPVAQRFLSDWKVYHAGRVDSAFLQQLATNIELSIHKLVLPIDTSDLNVVSHATRLEELLCERALMESDGTQKAADKLGLSKPDFLAIKERVDLGKRLRRSVD